MVVQVEQPLSREDQSSSELFQMGEMWPLTYDYQESES